MATMIAYITLLYTGTSPIYASTIFTMSIVFAFFAECSAKKVGFHFRNVRDANVSMERIENFLLATHSSETPLTSHSDLIPREKQEIETIQAEAVPSSVILTEMSAAWKAEGQPLVLHHISLTVRSKQLFMVTGPVGSGKSSLLMAILREIPIVSGPFEVRGRIAYVSQMPWIFSGTIRDNILFGRHFDESRYHRVLEACDLYKDIKGFPNEDLCIVGQRGVGLSGGQRARVSLARAVYSDADVFLLDDPLSAVDARVGQHIFDKCICGELSNRTRILVTHQEQHLPRLDKIAVIKEGRIVKQGTYSELDNCGLIYKLQEKIQTSDQARYQDNIDPLHRDGVTSNLEGQDMEEDEEDRAVGTVSWRTYWQFFRAGLPAILIGCLGLFCVAGQGTSILLMY